MNILYLITGLGGGGAEKVVADLADQMYLRGHDIVIAYLKGEVIVKPQSSDIKLICLELNKMSQFGNAFKNFKIIIEQFRPDIVHAHMVHANIFARLVRKYVFFPRLICTAHSNNEGGRLRMLAYRLTHSLADITTNVSKAASYDFEKVGAVPKNGIVTVYNGINLNKFDFNLNKRLKLRDELNLSSQHKMLLAVGRLQDAKDYPNLLLAFSLLLKKDNFYNNTRLYIVGEGSLKAELEKLIQILNLNNFVFLLGRRDDIPELMSASDIFVLSSRFEGFGLVVAEAMACETFVVATDCGGVKEVMGTSGILVPPENSSALAQGLASALSLNDNAIKINNTRALAYVRKTFNLENIIDQWLEIYGNK